MKYKRCLGIFLLLVALFAIDLRTGTARADEVARIGFVANADPRKNPLHMNAFREGLRENGYIEGKNIHIEYRWAVGGFTEKSDPVPALLEQGVDLIVTWGSAATAAAQKATSEIPIVMIAVSDPVGTGFVKSLARPGGNITGISNVSREIAWKWVEILSMIKPDTKRIAAVRNPLNPATILSAKEVEAATKQIGLEYLFVDVSAPDQIDAAFEQLAEQKADAVVITGDPMFASQRKRFAERALAHRLPSSFIVSIYPRAGGMMSYGPDPTDIFHRSAHYVARILKGTSPAELPVERPTEYELVINLKTVRKMGLELPGVILLRADEVIE